MEGNEHGTGSSWFDKASPGQESTESDIAKKVEAALKIHRGKQSTPEAISPTAHTEHFEITLKDGSKTLTVADQEMLNELEQAHTAMNDRAHQEEQKDIIRNELDK